MRLRLSNSLQSCNSQTAEGTRSSRCPSSPPSQKRAAWRARSRPPPPWHTPPPKWETSEAQIFLSLPRSNPQFGQTIPERFRLKYPSRPQQHNFLTEYRAIRSGSYLPRPQWSVPRPSNDLTGRRCLDQEFLYPRHSWCLTRNIQDGSALVEDWLLSAMGHGDRAEFLYPDWVSKNCIGSGKWSFEHRPVDFGYTPYDSGYISVRGTPHCSIYIYPHIYARRARTTEIIIRSYQDVEDSRLPAYLKTLSSFILLGLLSYPSSIMKNIIFLLH